MPYVGGQWVPEGRRREVATGLAGSAIARRQGSIDSLQEAYTTGNRNNNYRDLLGLDDEILRGYQGPSTRGFQTPDLGGNRPGQLLAEQSIGTGSLLGADPQVYTQPERKPFTFTGVMPQFTRDSRAGSKAGSDDALTRAVSTIANTADFDFQSNTLKTAYDRARSDFYAAQDAAIADLSVQYRDRIGLLQDELAGYRGGLSGVNAAYGAYADDANAILEEAASVTADPLDESAVDVDVEETFDDFDGEMAESLKKIDSSGNQALAKAMSDEVRYMEDTMLDGLRSGLATQDEMHALAGAQAQTLAHMAWKDDVYQAEKSRFTMETQINKTISDKQDEIAAQTKAMNDAIANARSQFGEFEMDPNQLWEAGMADYFANTEMDEISKQQILEDWNSIQQNNPNAFANYQTFKSQVMGNTNFKNLQSLGLADQYISYMSYLEQAGTPEQIAAAERMIQGTDSKRAIRQIVEAMISNGQLERGQYSRDYLDGQELLDVNSFETTTMLDLWKHYDDFSKNYNDYLETQNAANQNTPNVKRGRTAPNNARYKNNSDYVYRRNVVAPYFAQQVQRAFPGAEVGGLRYIRPANDKGGANVSNSDHHSGGAIDVYHKGGSAADTDATLRKIVRWADQPGVSFTVYDGQSAHQTGTSNAHVHISFQVGWKVP